MLPPSRSQAPRIPPVQATRPAAERFSFAIPAAGEDETACAKRILTSLAAKAFRREVRDSDLETLLGFYQEGKNAGGFEHGIEAAVARILIDPWFIFRFEKEPAGVAPGGVYPVSDIELASRLSFFLWSSIPDEELLRVAAAEQAA